MCGTSLVAEDVFSKVVSGHGAHLDTFGEFEVLRFSLDLSSTDKRTIRVGELERDHDVRIIAFERSDGSASSYSYARLYPLQRGFGARLRAP